MFVSVEKKKRRSALPQAPAPAPIDREARARSLQREIERQAVVDALRARGDTIDPRASYDELRKSLTDAEWDSLVIDGLKIKRGERPR